jgi:glycogen phosphorylase
VNTDELRSQLTEIAGNLASQWNGGRELLNALVAAGGDPWASPQAALGALDAARLQELFGSRRSEVESAVRALRDYLSQETWFDRAVSRDSRLAALRDGPIAYFCSEFAVTKWLPIYSGGLGVLAGDALKEASDMGLPFMGIGLFYRHGYFHQKLNAEQRQTEYYDTLDPVRLGLQRARGADGKDLLISVPMADREVQACVWTVPVGRVTLYLLDTNVPENADEADREITGTLYGGDQETRIRQEMVLGIGGVRTAHALGFQPSIASMNEGHAAFLGVELLADQLPSSDLTTALSHVRSHIVYTNHTVVPAGNDIFGHDLVRRYLGPYVDARGIGIDYLLSLASPGQDSGFQMAVLAFQMSGRANAVSEIHAQVIPREWPGFHVEAVTNGVHVPTWTGPIVQSLLDEYVPDWRGDSPDWTRVHDIPSERLHAAREEQRHMMIDHLNGLGVTDLDPEALTFVWARRFAEYKRAGLVGTDPSRLARILGDESRPVQLIFSGKSHPRDEGGKNVMQSLLQLLEGETALARRVSFVEDYNLEVASYLTMGADVWLNTPRKPLEASGTSGMKSSDNGGIQVTVTDGWAAEVDWYDVGWGITGLGDEEDARELYHFLETGVIPTFFNRNEEGVSEQWLHMVKNTMMLTLAKYSSRRMLLDYIHKLYLPLLSEQGAVAAGA